MTFLNELKDRAMGLAQTGVAKSKQIAEIAKLTLANAGEEEAIKKAYIEIGKLYYAERGMAPDPAYISLCEKITGCKTTIEENRTRISELKSSGELTESDLAAAEELLQDLPMEEPAAPEAPVIPDLPEE